MKTVKAWAIVGADGEFHFNSEGRRVTFQRKHIAKDWILPPSSGHRIVRVEIRALPKVKPKKRGGAK